MEHAQPMINYNQMYHVDDIVLSAFCPNTNRVDKVEKYSLFKKHLSSFHKESSIYEDSLNNYIAYIINSILLNSLELNKNILSYESYFYNVIQGFATQRSFKVLTSNIAKYWNNLVQTYDMLLQELSKDTVKTVTVLQKGHAPIRYINHNKVNDSYYWDIPIQVTLVDESIINILIIPVHSNTTVLSNFAVLNTIKYTPNSGSLFVIQVSLDTANIKFININLSTVTRGYVFNFLRDFYVDFSTANLMNCPICPVSPCTTEHMFKVVQPTKAHKIKKIRLVNI